MSKVSKVSNTRSETTPRNMDANLLSWISSSLKNSVCDSSPEIQNSYFTILHFKVTGFFRESKLTQQIGPLSNSLLKYFDQKLHPIYELVVIMVFKKFFPISKKIDEKWNSGGFYDAFEFRRVHGKLGAAEFHVCGDMWCNDGGRTWPKSGRKLIL